MARGLLDGLVAIPAIMKVQDCSWDEAKALWVISMEVEAEQRKALAEAAAESNVIPFRAKH